MLIAFVCFWFFSLGALMMLWQIMEKRKWQKFVDATIPLKDTITISINGKDYEYNPTENFEEFMKNITKPLDK